MKKPFAFIWVILLLPGLCLGNCAFAHGENDENVLSSNRVLMISSYSINFPVVDDQIQGVRSVLNEVGIRVDVEFMDSKRFPSQDNVDNFHRRLKYKVDRLPPYGAVITADDNALEYVMLKRNELFTNTPVVFLGINNLDKAHAYAKDPLVTGVVEISSVEETISVGKQINPQASRVVALLDKSRTGRADLKQFYDAKAHFPRLEFDDINMGDISFEELSIELKKLTENDIFIFISAYHDKTGETITFEQSAKKVLKHINIPAYHLQEFGVKAGMMGGCVVRHSYQGIEAGRRVKAILEGADMKTMLVEAEGSSHYLFNAQALKKFHISKAKLPQSASIINQDETILRKYFPYIAITFAILILQAIFIFHLNRNIQKRKKAEHALFLSRDEIQQSNEELTASNEELLAINEELFLALDEIQKQKKKIDDLINIDSLTGLWNRRAITKIIDEKINSSTEEEFWTVIFLDVDNFKNINDTFGHDVGDRVIYETGQKLKSIENGEITVGRFGGDEFLILASGQKIDMTAERIAQKIQDEFQDPLIVDESRFFLTLSLGASVFPNHGETQKELIKKADMALYEAKRSGKNRLVVFDHSRNAAMEAKMTFQTYIKEGFSKNEFYMNYQPYYNLKSGEIIGFEALIRWKSDRLGQVSPYDLITNAEEMGLIVSIGRWIFEKACRLSQLMNASSERTIYMSINVSAVQLMHKKFIQQIEHILEMTGADPRKICMEMTETVFIHSQKIQGHIIEKLREMGFNIAIDDFGTGYSSLGYFKSLPASILKIDKIFIDNIHTDSYDRQIVKAVIGLAHEKQLEVIAEGVEIKEQVEALLDVKCDMVQGYFYNRPLDEKTALEILHNS